MLKRPHAFSLTFFLLAIVACGHASNDTKLVGTWQYTTMDAVGRMTFTADHKVVGSFPKDATVDARLPDAQFVVVTAGTWRLEGQELVTEMDDKPLVDQWYAIRREAGDLGEKPPDIGKTV